MKPVANRRYIFMTNFFKKLFLFLTLFSFFYKFKLYHTHCLLIRIQYSCDSRVIFTFLYNQEDHKG